MTQTFRESLTSSSFQPLSAHDKASKHPIPQTWEPELFLSFKLKTLNVFIFLLLDIFFAY